MRPLLLLLIALAIPAQAAERRIDVRPYLEVDQVVLADFKNGGDVLTYTTLAAGVDAAVRTRRTEAQINYRYEHRFAWDDNLGDADIHTGLARGRTWVVPNLLQFDAGAIATRTRSDIRGFAPNPLVGNPDNVSQLYSAYLGPTLSTRLGDFDVNGAYRFGYTKVESRNRGLLPVGQPLLDSFDDATTHVATASVGMGSGVLPFGWTISGGYQREDASQLDQQFESAYARADIVVPVSPTVAIVGGVGYETTEASQRDALRDVNGVPVLDSNGRFITDPASPRRLAYDQDGIIWDTGVLWRPSRRTSLEARIGRRYGSMTYIGSFSWQPNDNMAVQIGVYDGIQTFGRQLNQGLAALPTQFTVARNPFANSAGGCVFAVNSGAGGCLDDALQSVATGTYRSRGVNAVWRYNRGPWQAGVGLGYAHRRFFAPSGAFFTPDGVIDQSWYAQGYVSRALDEASGIDASVYANWFESGIAGAPDVLGTGATASYYRNFTDHLSGTASLGLYSTRVEDLNSSLIGSALIGARYQF